MGGGCGLALLVHDGPMVKLWHGDCADVIRALPRNSIDLLVTDPPYGVKWRSNRGENFTHLTGDDGALDVPGILGAAVTALRNHRHVYVFGYGADVLSGPLRLGGTTELIWDKCQPGLGNLQLPYGPQHERITFGMYVPSRSDRESGMGRLSARMRKGSVIRVPRPNGTAVTKHPTEKPIRLMRQLIESSSLLGDTVFDPFAGSCSTLVAAALTGRNAIGVEIDGQFIDAAIMRIKRAEALALAIDKA